MEQGLNYQTFQNDDRPFGRQTNLNCILKDITSMKEAQIQPIMPVGAFGPRHSNQFNLPRIQAASAMTSGLRDAITTEVAEEPLQSPAGAEWTTSSNMSTAQENKKQDAAQASKKVQFAVPTSHSSLVQQTSQYQFQLFNPNIQEPEELKHKYRRQAPKSTLIARNNYSRNLLK